MKRLIASGFCLVWAGSAGAADPLLPAQWQRPVQQAGGQVTAPIPPGTTLPVGPTVPALAPAGTPVVANGTACATCGSTSGGGLLGFGLIGGRSASGACPTCGTVPGQPCATGGSQCAKGCGGKELSFSQFCTWITYRPGPPVMPLMNALPYQTPLWQYFPCQPGCGACATGCAPAANAATGAYPQLGYLAAAKTAGVPVADAKPISAPAQTTTGPVQNNWAAPNRVPAQLPAVPTGGAIGRTGPTVSALPTYTPPQTTTALPGTIVRPSTQSQMMPANSTVATPSRWDRFVEFFIPSSWSDPNTYVPVTTGTSYSPSAGGTQMPPYRFQAPSNAAPTGYLQSANQPFTRQ
ncbi:hypothetical protein [Fimbriiglobus ruber]|uniref:Uncharacterized protein n=1 Tax=Fimbriiglobus ruber TaxID=1908690 RepID=A0A225DBF4_9BACT|nr:hypothetical protein [Fimbriiglobus ruber]OWK38313.1 hypothetical protein FRUB_07433 [Fimbriiglobus ruber]